VVDTDWYIEADQPKVRFVIDKEKAALHGISAETISETLRIAVGGESVDLLHVPREKEDVNIVFQLPLASRTSPEELLALRVRSGDANALPEPVLTGSAPPLVPLRELVTVERTITDKSIYHKNLMPVTYVIGDVAGVVESPVYAILKMNQALRQLDARDFGGALASGTARTGNESKPAGLEAGVPSIKIFNAVQPFTDNSPSIKWDGEWHITIEVFRDLGLAFAAVLVLIYILLVGWFRSFLTPLIIMAAIPFSLVASCRARRVARLLHGNFDDWFHGRRGHCGAQFHHLGGLHRTAVARRHAAGGSRGGCRRGAFPADAVDGAGGGGGRERDSSRPDFPGPGDLADGGGDRIAAHQPHGRPGALLHGLQPQAGAIRRSPVNSGCTRYFGIGKIVADNVRDGATTFAGLAYG